MMADRFSQNDRALWRLFKRDILVFAFLARKNVTLRPLTIRIDLLPFLGILSEIMSRPSLVVTGVGFGPPFL